jgi:ParB family chromosome partitioning protein
VATGSALAIAENGEAGQTAPNSRTVDPALEDVASALENHLETKVVVTKTQKKGRITIEFADIDDLGRIAKIIKGT